MSAARSVWLVAGLAVTAGLMGWLIANGETKLVAAVLIAVPVLFVVLTTRASAPVLGILLLVVVNGVPGINLGGRLPGGVRAQDFAVVALIVLLFMLRDRRPQARSALYNRAVKIWSACFLAWWTFSVARSILIDAVPFRYAVLFGRDFLYFGLLLPLALQVRLSPRSLRVGALVLLGGAAVYAFGQTVAGLTGVTLSWLVHPTHNALVIGQSRFYSPMNDVVDTCLIIVAAFYLSKDAPGDRRIIGPLFLLMAAAVVLGLTRANYFGMAVAALACSIVYARRHGSVTAVVTRVVVGVLLVIAALTLFTAITGHSGLSGNPIVKRISLGLTDISNSTGTFGYRKGIDETMLKVLGTQWPIGLGFLHPAVHYFPSLPSGSIRNADTGVFNSLMTMGLVGTLLLYAPLAYAFRELLRLSRRSETVGASLPRWVLYGGIGWLSWVVAGSATLVFLFEVTGLVFAAFVLAALGWAIRETTSTPVASAAAGSMPTPAPSGVFNGSPGPRPARSPRLNGRMPEARSPRVNGRMPAASPARVNGRMPAARPARVNGRMPAARPAPANRRRPEPARFVAGTPEPTRLAMPALQPAPAALANVDVPSQIAAPRELPAQITAVIVTYNSGHCIRECIKSLRTVLGACEIVVVDNDSDDGTIFLARATDERVRVLCKGRNAGYGSACNSGVRAATNEHVIIMNPDVRLEHADLDELARTFSEATLGLVAPGLRSDDQKNPAHPQTFGRSTWLSELNTMALGPFRPRGLSKRSRQADSDSDVAAWASGALMVVRRTEFLQLEGFDERFFLYYEDQDLGIRYRDAGLPIRGTEALSAVHQGGQSVAEEGDQRVDAMAWCLLGWLEFVAIHEGPRRARLSWEAIQMTYRVGGRLTTWAAGATRIGRLRRKAQQLKAVDAMVRQIARAGVGFEHQSCPAACKVVDDGSRR